MKAPLTIALTFLIAAVSAQEKVYLSGFVNDITTLLPLSYVNVSSKGRVIASTDQNGFFSFSAMQGDTVVFTRLGYKPYTLVAKENNWDERVFLNEMSKMLDEVTITDSYKFQGHDEMEKSLDKDAKTKSFDNITMHPENQKGMVQTFGPSVTVGAPWSNWTKEQREKRQLQAVLNDKQKTAVYNDFIHSMVVEEYFIEQFSIDHETYLKFKEGFIVANPDARYLSSRQDIVDLMVSYIASKKP